MDENIVKQIVNNNKFINKKYPHYFMPEIQPFINEKWFPKYDPKDFSLNEKVWVNEIQNKLADDFYEKRKIGENDDYICQIIRKDLIEEFIVYINKNSYPIRSKIKLSIYETNNFLLIKEKVTLIEYAVFFGSSQIFNYLRKNGVVPNSALCIYAIHVFKYN